jgi:hypothetical protein
VQSSCLVQSCNQDTIILQNNPFPCIIFQNNSLTCPSIFLKRPFHLHDCDLVTAPDINLTCFLLGKSIFLLFLFILILDFYPCNTHYFHDIFSPQFFLMTLVFFTFSPKILNFLISTVWFSKNRTRPIFT